MDTLSRIVLLLKEQGKQQKELANYLGISTNCITDWKSGRNKSYLKYVNPISDFLGTTPDYLLGKTDKKEKPTADEGDEREELLKLLGKMFTNLSEEQKETVLRYAEFLEKNQ